MKLLWWWDACDDNTLSSMWPWQWQCRSGRASEIITLLLNETHNSYAICESRLFYELFALFSPFSFVCLFLSMNEHRQTHIYTYKRFHHKHIVYKLKMWTSSNERMNEWMWECACIVKYIYVCVSTRFHK